MLTNTIKEKIMRKSTINLMVGIIIGLLISGISDVVNTESEIPSVPQTSAATTINSPLEKPTQPFPFERRMAPGLQIVEVPHPLNINGAYPYQCYFNGEIVKLPKEMVKQFLDENGVENSPDVNVHNFLGNLEYISVPVGTSTPQSVNKDFGRTR